MPAGVSWTSDDDTRAGAPASKTDQSIWDSWVHGPGLIGSTQLDPVTNPDTLYVS